MISEVALTYKSPAGLHLYILYLYLSFSSPAQTAQSLYQQTFWRIEKKLLLVTDFKPVFPLSTNDIFTWIFSKRSILF
jgi:hypothetical protein